MQINDLYASVTDQLIATLEQGDLPPWRKPWNKGDASFPLRHNGIPYRGINTILLWISSLARGFSSPYYLTFKQAQEYGGCVRKGEKSTPIIWCEPVARKGTAEDGAETEDRFWLSKVYHVFSADQCDGLPDRFTAKPVQTLDIVQRIEHADTFARNTGADIHHSAGGAFYLPSEDFIHMPLFESFESASAYYGTLCHELCHWSGHSSRLNRDLKGFGHRKEYAQEEIIAELGSAFILANLGIQPPDLGQHAAYIEFWIDALKEDKRYLFTAASKAQAAADFLNGLQPAV